MKKVWFYLLTIWFSQFCIAETKELIILNWPDYLSKEVINSFEKEFDVTIKQLYFDSSSDRHNHLFATRGKGFDIANVSEQYLSQYAKIGWLMPLEKALVPNLKHIDPQYLRFQENQLLGIPFHWGTIGITYRKDLVKYPITSWKQILEPTEDLKNKISVIKEGFDLTAIALKSLGYSANETNSHILEKAQEILLNQKAFVKRYAIWTSSSTYGLLTGSEAVGINYNGDAVSMNKINSNISYSYPEEGCLLWVDYWVILPSSPNKELAYKFLNYLMKPEIAMANSIELNYATTNKTALNLLPEEYLNNPIIFPTPQHLKNCEYLHSPDDINILKSYNHLLIKLLQQ